jgi:capsular exopolysaccharide synthesis family protein
MVKQDPTNQIDVEKNTSEETEMRLIDYLLILARRKWVILLTTVLTLTVAALWVSQTPPRYTARTTLRVMSARAGSADYVEYNTQYAEMVIGTYVRIATSSTVLNELSRYVSKVPVIKAEAVANTELIQITAEDEDPALAQFAANKLAEILIANSRGSAPYPESTATIDVVEPAVIPTTPSSPSPQLLLGLALAVGLLGGTGLAFVFDSLDTRLYLIRQIESVTGVPVIGNIPDNRAPGPGDWLLFGKALHVEAFYRLRTNLFSLARNGNLKTFLVTSAVPKDGKSSVAANLAVSIGRANRKVVVVDANLRATRSPSIHHFFGLDNEFGLSNVLRGELKASEVVRPSSIPRLKVITSGPLPPNPVELLSSQRMADTLSELAAEYDFVLLDSPSSVSVTDPAVLAPLVDGVLLTVRQGWVRREALQAACQHLRNVDANLVGIVANRTDLGTRSRFSRQRLASKGV